MAARAGYCATVTVKPGGGGSATTINQALELLDYNDGVDDLVLIDPGTYDEQITANGNAGVDSVAFPPAISLTTAALEMTFMSHPDALELRGVDPDNPPILTVISSTPTAYGFITNNTGKSFVAGLVHAGNNVTFTNLNIRHGEGTAYGIYGMAKGIVYQDCLFTNGQPIEASHAFFWRYDSFSRNLSYFNPNIAADNEYLVQNCIMDGRSVVDDTLYDNDFVLFSSYGDEPLDFSMSQPLGGAAVVGCVIKNFGSSIFRWRGRIGIGSGLGYTRVEDSYFHNINGAAVILRGNQGPSVINRNVFENLSASQGNPIIQTGEKNGLIPAPVSITNNIFHFSRGIRILSIGSPGGDPRPYHHYRIVNNTFHRYIDAVDISGASPTTALVANNLFQGHPTITVGTAIRMGAGTGAELNSTNNLFHNTLAVSGFPFANMTGPVIADPRFLSIGTTEPNPPGSLTPQGFVPDPSNSPAINAGDFASYTIVAASAGNLDVDRSPRIIDSVIDIGAQEIAFVPPTNTPTRTPTNTPTQTPTRTATPSLTPTRTFTSTLTPSQTRTPTRTNTPSVTLSPTATNTSMATATPTSATSETSTPTETPTPFGTPTDTGSPTATSTPCPGLVFSETSDFNGDGEIDVKDLLLLYDHIRSGSGLAEDLNCDGLLTYFDLFRFSQSWEETLTK